MYLTQLVLNPFSAAVQRDIADAYALHRTVMSGYPATIPAGERVLHRLELSSDTGALTLLVQSLTAPDWSHLAGYTALPPAMREWTPAFTVGASWRFRLVGNPVVVRDGRRCPLPHTDEQLGWLLRKGQLHGFDVLAVTPTRHHVVGMRHRSSGYFVLNAVQFDGVLQCTDADALVSAVSRGIGRARAFGCGLLTLARV
jgi:CRISPR system Cascade subunit CasE